MHPVGGFSVMVGLCFPAPRQEGAPALGERVFSVFRGLYAGLGGTVAGFCLEGPVRGAPSGGR